jgi:predicted  nucleic acid-binding Zn-ribbon protein
MSSPFKLYRLQTIDTQLDGMKHRIRDIDELLTADQELQLALKEAEKAKVAWQLTQKNLRLAEDQVRQQRLKIEQSEATLYSGRMQNPKELQDLQNEVASLKRYLSVLEDRQLENMLAEEEASSEVESANQSLEKIRAQKESQNAKLDEERERLLKDVDRFQGERNAAISDIPKADLDLYEKLRIQRRGVAVSKVVDKACSACGSTLNASLLHAAHSANQISRCDLCGRILYIG